MIDMKKDGFIDRRAASFGKYNTTKFFDQECFNVCDLVLDSLACACRRMNIIVKGDAFERRPRRLEADMIGVKIGFGE